jgi:hypothetical protein
MPASPWFFRWLMAPSARPPAALKAAGKRLWKDVTSGLTLRPDELAILAEAGKVADQIAALERAVARGTTLVPGSTGQPRLNPAIGELRLQRQALAALLARLDIPEDTGLPRGEWDGISASTRARMAARRRWGQRGA